MSILDKIKELSNNKGLSLAALERLLDFSNGSISRWENSSPSVDKVKRVANYFNVSVDYLLDNNFPHSSKKIYFRMNTDNLSEDEIEEIHNQLAFAEKLALEAIRRKKGDDL